MIKIIKVSFVFLTALILSRTSMAYLTVGETAEVLPEGYYKLGLQPQAVISDGSGFNMGVYLDTYLEDGINGRIEIGGGETEFWTAGTVKWVPIPDVDKQPAVGIRGGFSYARDSGADLYHLLIAPIISKKADTRYGEMIPFIALPISIPVIDTKVNNTTGTQLAIGAEWFYADVNYGLELDLNLGRSFSAISAFISFPFDSATGYKK
ncbi:MAG: hypothetical protein A2622_10880 [Bdellovibrionales bacterium RIFCSPHIGHO2_01_FULL_40_29]|nr:MAG: hypothetical protein A2622_10880 [Bdellovibrionales bacterium RIFCSPHIGHO2_01_FULL_40_29]OFZ34598.1 MAG: hypothetical protein A3D17_01145 [Bdellovibrionales bacterium RIFCSPHIGHO2_02_FULL_40_15]